MKNIYIVGAKRSPIGSFLGSLTNVSLVDMATPVINEILSETSVSKDEIDEVIVGHLLSAGQKQGIARQVSIGAGINIKTPAYSLNMACGSGMKAVMNGYADIMLGEHIVLAGGVESMTQAPHYVKGVRSGQKMGSLTLEDHMLVDALTDAFEGYHMGITAENIVDKYKLTREQQDEFAINSQTKAIVAQDKGIFKDEIVPIVYQTRKGEVVFGDDEYINRTTTLEKLGTLRPAFKKDGSVTAGNASGINDGVSFTLLMDEETMNAKGLKPLVRIVSFGQGGVDPSIMGMGPVEAIKAALIKANLKLSDMDVIELNEAFAAQSLGVIKELALQHDLSEEEIKERTNVNGGAIALGHPVGASGNRIIVSLIHEMLRSNKKYGLASLCIGGGMGTAIIVEKVEE